MKPFPPLNSDEEAEDFVANADLTEYDPAQMVTMKFERAKGAGNVHLPEPLLEASRARAANLGISLDSFVRSAIEHALSGD